MAKLARLQNMAFMRRLEDKLKCVEMVSTDSAVLMISMSPRSGMQSSCRRKAAP